MIEVGGAAVGPTFAVKCENMQPAGAFKIRGLSASPRRQRSSWNTRRAGGRPGVAAVPRATPQIATPVQRHATGQHPAGPAGAGGGPARAALRAAVLGVTWPTWRRAWRARGAAGVKLSGGQVRRAAAARIRAHPGAAGRETRPVQRALDMDTEQQLWERLSFIGPITHLPGRLPPPRCSAPRRPHHRAQRWAGRVGHTGYAACHLRGDAAPVAWGSGAGGCGGADLVLS